MRPLARFGRRAFAALLCLSLVVWSVMPTVNHAPTVFETIQDHLEMIAEHGHSHGFEEDLLLAMHGHSHDAADHDHGEAHVALGAPTRRASPYRDARRARGSPDAFHRKFRIERPPRA
jgi:hypothetical protein